MVSPADAREHSRRPGISTERLEAAERRLEQLEELATELAQSMRNSRADPSLVDKFILAAKEATRTGAMLELLREAERERQENQTFMQISMAFSSALSIDDLFRSILDSLQKVVRYDAAGIFLYDRELGQLEIDFLRGYEGTDHELILRKFQEGVRLGDGVVGSVIKSGRPLYVPDTRSDPVYIVGRVGTRSELAVPIKVSDEVIGALNLESDDVDAFSARDVNSLMIFASHAGVALERARAERVRMHAKRIEEEIAIARRIQESFLPQNDPSFDPYDIAGINIPSSEVGGDYYDFISITDTDMGLVIGDVSGHGAGASLLMATFRACLRIESRNNFAIRTILSKVNEFIYETNPPDAFVTAVYGVLDRKNHIFSYSNAGHNYPMLLRNDGTVEKLDVGGTLLGAFANIHYEETRIPLRPGDTLLFYTDGVTESMDASGREFGLPRLVELTRQLAGKSAREIAAEISDAVLEYRSDEQPQDDLTVSVVKYVRAA